MRYHSAAKALRPIVYCRMHYVAGTGRLGTEARGEVDRRASVSSGGVGRLAELVSPQDEAAVRRSSEFGRVGGGSHR